MISGAGGVVSSGCRITYPLSGGLKSGVIRQPPVIQGGKTKVAVLEPEHKAVPLPLQRGRLLAAQVLVAVRIHVRFETVPGIQVVNKAANIVAALKSGVLNNLPHLTKTGLDL